MESQRAYHFLVVLLLILPAKVFSQQEMPRIEQISPHTLKFSLPFSQITLGCYDKENKQPLPERCLQKSRVMSVNTYALSRGAANQIEVISAHFYAQHLGFFCRKELQIEKVTTTPFRIRLGSLEYVNRLEGKK